MSECCETVVSDCVVMAGKQNPFDVAKGCFGGPYADVPARVIVDAVVASGHSEDEAIEVLIQMIRYDWIRQSDSVSFEPSGDFQSELQYRANIKNMLTQPKEQ